MNDKNKTGKVFCKFYNFLNNECISYDYFFIFTLLLVSFFCNKAHMKNQLRSAWNWLHTSTSTGLK